MNALTLLLILGGNGVRLTRQGDRLHVDAPAGFLTHELKEALRDNKDELLRWIELSAEAARSSD